MALPALNIIARRSGGDHMPISLNEIDAQHWTLVSIAIVAVGCWILAESIEFFEDRRRTKQRFVRSLV